MFRAPCRRPFPFAQNSLSRPSGALPRFTDSSVTRPQPLEHLVGPFCRLPGPQTSTKAGFPPSKVSIGRFCSACLPALLMTGTERLQPRQPAQVLSTARTQMNVWPVNGQRLDPLFMMLHPQDALQRQLKLEIPLFTRGLPGRPESGKSIGGLGRAAGARGRQCRGKKRRNKDSLPSNAYSSLILHVHLRESAKTTQNFNRT